MPIVDIKDYVDYIEFADHEKSAIILVRLNKNINALNSNKEKQRNMYLCQM